MQLHTRLIRGGNTISHRRFHQNPFAEDCYCEDMLHLDGNTLDHLRGETSIMTTQIQSSGRQGEWIRYVRVIFDFSSIWNWK